MLLKAFTSAFLALSVGVSAVAATQAAGYQQCGGANHAGPTQCEHGYHCERLNDYFYQCLPGHGTATSVAYGSTVMPQETVMPRAQRTTASLNRATPTPSVPRHLVEYTRRDRERRAQAAAASSQMEIQPMYPRPTETLTAEDIDQINLLDDIEAEILRISRHGGLSMNSLP